MRISDIPTDIFIEAHEEALVLTPEDEREMFLADNIALALVDRIFEEEQLEANSEAERVRNKIKHAITGIQEDRGLKYLTEKINRTGFRNAFFHRMAARMTLSDMSQNVRKASGEFQAINLKVEKE